MLANFLKPVDPEKLLHEPRSYARTWGAETAFPADIDSLEESETHLALIGVPGSRQSAGRIVSDGSTDRIRRALYPLAAGHPNQRIADLGDVIPGETEADTRVAVREICGELIDRGIVPIVIGKGQALTHPIYEAFEKRKNSINLVSVDTHIDLIDHPEVTETSWIWHVLDREPSHLFNFTAVAYQSHFVPHELVDSLEKLHFEHLRLGRIRDDIRLVEPAVRDADIVSFDLNSVRASDSMAHPLAGPNGLFGEEACRIARYAGISDKLGAFGVFGYDADLDRRGMAAALVAQMIWYFVDGFYNRKGDIPPRERGEFLRYTVAIGQEGESHEMTFLKSTRSGRWWMEVPFQVSDEEEEHNAIFPCSYEDYEAALKQEVPDRWLRAMHRLNV